jgi:aminoglycoside/choline kinase family phosphotransferase
MAEIAADASEVLLDKQSLTVALKSSGRLREAQVEEVRVTPIGQGQGLTAELLRVQPTYSTYESNAPRSVIIKRSSGDGPAQDIARSLRFMERECGAYSEIRRTGRLRRPACYHYSLDRDVGDGILFLEDLGGMTPGDQIAGPDEGQTNGALIALASFHAEWWDNDIFNRPTVFPRFNDPSIVAIVQNIYDAARAPFEKNFAKGLPSDFLGILDFIAENMTAFADRLAEPPVTYLHGDFRADNLFFDQKSKTPEIWAIDWQITCVGSAVFDAAYFISQSVDLGGSDSAERTLLETYHKTLISCGVTDYSFERCLLDYRRSVVYGLVYVVIACGFLSEGDERSARLCDKLLERVVPLSVKHFGADLL